LKGADLDPVNTEAYVIFNSDYANWYYGTDGNPGGNVDFVSVALHEVGHGMNFLDLINQDGSWSADGLPGIYDRFLETGVGTDLTTMTDAQRAAAIISNDLFWSGAEGQAGNDGVRPKIYAPNPYESGSGVSHVDQSQHPAALMTPHYNGVKHALIALELGMLADMGWNVIGLSLGGGDGFSSPADEYDGAMGDMKSARLAPSRTLPLPAAAFTSKVDACSVVSREAVGSDLFADSERRFDTHDLDKIFHEDSIPDFDRMTTMVDQQHPADRAAVKQSIEKPSRLSEHVFASLPDANETTELNDAIDLLAFGLARTLAER
jgi:hypothetical protein